MLIVLDIYVCAIIRIQVLHSMSLAAERLSSRGSIDDLDGGPFDDVR